LDKCLTIILIHGFIATNKAFNGPEKGSEVKSKHLFHLFHEEDVVYIVWLNQHPERPNSFFYEDISDIHCMLYVFDTCLNTCPAGMFFSFLKIGSSEVGTGWRMRGQVFFMNSHI